MGRVYNNAFYAVKATQGKKNGEKRAQAQDTGQKVKPGVPGTSESGGKQRPATRHACFRLWAWTPGGFWEPWSRTPAGALKEAVSAQQGPPRHGGRILTSLSNGTFQNTASTFLHTFKNICCQNKNCAKRNKIKFDSSKRTEPCF